MSVIAVVRLRLVRVRTACDLCERETFAEYKKHSNRVLWVIDLSANSMFIVQHTDYIGEWQSLRLIPLGQAENSIVSNVC